MSMTLLAQTRKEGKRQRKAFQRSLGPTECAHLDCPNDRDPGSELFMCPTHHALPAVVSPRSTGKQTRCIGCQYPLGATNRKGLCLSCSTHRKRISFYDHTERYIAA